MPRLPSFEVELPEYTGLWRPHHRPMVFSVYPDTDSLADPDENFNLMTPIEEWDDWLPLTRPVAHARGPRPPTARPPAPHAADEGVPAQDDVDEPIPMRRTIAHRGVPRPQRPTMPAHAEPTPRPVAPSSPPLPPLRPPSPLRRTVAHRGFSRRFLHETSPSPLIPAAAAPTHSSPLPLSPPRPLARTTAHGAVSRSDLDANAAEPTSSAESSTLVTPSTSMQLSPLAAPFRPRWIIDKIDHAPPPTPVDMTTVAESSDMARVSSLVPSISEALFAAEVIKALRELQSDPDRSSR